VSGAELKPLTATAGCLCCKKKKAWGPGKKKNGGKHAATEYAFEVLKPVPDLTHEKRFKVPITHLI